MVWLLLILKALQTIAAIVIYLIQYKRNFEKQGAQSSWNGRDDNFVVPLSKDLPYATNKAIGVFVESHSLGKIVQSE